jgi:hypothetical protein
MPYRRFGARVIEGGRHQGVGEAVAVRSTPPPPSEEIIFIEAAQQSQQRYSSKSVSIAGASFRTRLATRKPAETPAHDIAPPLGAEVFDVHGR